MIKYLEKLQNIYFDYMNENIGENLKYSIFRIENEKVKLKKLSKKYYKLNGRIYSQDFILSEKETFETFQKYVMLKGLLNKIDYAASSYIPVEEKNDFLEEKMDDFLKNVLKKDNPENDWNELQKFMIHK